MLQQHHLLHMSIPIASPYPVCQESLLENLQMESSSPMLCYPLSMSPLPSIGKSSVDKDVPEHVQISMSYENYAMIICSFIHDLFLDCLIYFQRELSSPNHSFQLEIVELRGAGEEPGEIVLVNYIPLIPDNLPHPTLQIISCLISSKLKIPILDLL